jgi:hypothetical protein
MLLKPARPPLVAGRLAAVLLEFDALLLGHAVIITTEAFVMYSLALAARMRFAQLSLGSQDFSSVFHEQ